MFTERWTQALFWFRDDDGSETGATFKGTPDSTQDLDVNTNYRVRIRINANHVSTGSADFTGTWQYQNVTQSTGWNNITTTSSHVKAAASLDTSWTISDGDATTEQTIGPATFVAGEMDETGSMGAVTMSETQESEFELVFQVVGADVNDNDTIQIRLVDDGAALDTYASTPELTVNKPSTVVPPSAYNPPDQLIHRTRAH